MGRAACRGTPSRSSTSGSTRCSTTTRRSSYAREGEDLTERFWPPTFHLIGKDILKFHAVYWPAFLMAAGIELPKRIFIHGYLLMEGEKMSKSLGNVLDPFQVIDMFGADALRYYCFREVTFGQDGSISTEGFESRYETELANEYGNLASRDARDDRALPRRRRARRARPSRELAARPRRAAPERVRELLDRAELTQALEEIWKRGAPAQPLRRGARPWELAKDDSAAERLDQVLYSLAEGIAGDHPAAACLHARDDRAAPGCAR